jgi:electron transfer flavoprotein beta subunit
VQEYAGGRLAVLGLQLPAVVGVQSASSPPRYIAMARLRQAMTEATAETLDVSVQAPATASKLISLTRPAPQAQATMIEGDAEQAAAQIAEVLRERGVLGD